MFKLLSTYKSVFRGISLLPVATLSLLSLGTLASKPVQAAAFNNGSFESEFTGWMTTGDVSTVSTFNGFDPTDGSFQALLTTAVTIRDDDGVGNGAYNFSGTDATLAIVNDDVDGQPQALLQAFLGLDNDALQIDTPITAFTGIQLDSKEGSAIKQSFSFEHDFNLSFDWKFLTNDGNTTGLFPLPADRAIVTIFDGTGTVIETFAQSEGNFPAPGSLTSPEFDKKSQGTFSKALAAGDYTVGIAVYDLDGTDKTSALLIDNVVVDKLSVKTPEPVNILGIMVAAGIGYLTKRRRDN
ncbi:MAG: hypothetical protein F6K23_18970 [Okeania sp. SIO2C9]|uniref:hypothetical protein n=1 Tax=Okeania sp. SIO2C9 TaxID=2607791 RepID=UPI0013C060B8|nr:hypothetical protein [Okeania sp. SIO2C9]NEQ74936.1 hypothetical protein [Okeania sp. SIO2C9]